MSDKNNEELFNTVKELAENEDNWQTNYYYENDEKILINYNNEIQFKNVPTDQENEMKENFTNFKNIINLFFKNDKQDLQLTGYNNVGSSKILMITSKDGKLINDCIEILSCSLQKNGMFSFNIEYEIDSKKIKELVFLLIDEEDFLTLSK
jgi:hypothetical protein